MVFIPVSETGETGSNFAFSAVGIALHITSIILLLFMPNQSTKNLLAAAAIGVFITMSAIWSPAPMTSLTYGGMVAGNILTAYMISRDLSLSEFIKLFARIILVVAILGMIAALLGYGQVYYFDTHDRPNIFGQMPVRGFFNHKVLASLFASLGAVACLHSFSGLKRFLSVLALGIFILMTGSSTGMVLLPIALLSYGLMAVVRYLKFDMASFVVTGLFVGIPTAAAFFYNWETTLHLLGRDETLTGRTVLWDWGIQRWLERPGLGWGFNGYLSGPEATAINSAVRQMQNYEVPHFHQSYIQTLVDLGLIGGIILLGIIVSIVLRSYRMMLVDQSNVAVVVLATMMTMIVAGMTMFIFIQYNHFATLLLFTYFFMLRPDGGGPGRRQLNHHRSRSTLPIRGARHRGL